MLTQKLYITETTDDTLLVEYQQAYTKLFYKLYNNAELMADDEFIKCQLNEYIDKSTYDVCVNDVKVKLKQYETSRNKKLNQIEEIIKLLEKDNFVTNKEKRHKYKLINKLTKLKRTIDNNITFGGKQLARGIEKLNRSINLLNDELIKVKQNKEIKLNEVKELEKIIKDKQTILTKYRAKFKENRLLGFSFTGRANEKGNRKFNFDLNNNLIIFKPNKNTKINIKFNYRDSQTKELLSKLQELADDKQIPLTINIKGKYIHLSYDNEYINGYSFNQNEFNRERSTLTDSEEKKQLYIKFIREQEDKKKLNKITNRYLSVDLNPNYIGLSIFDSKDNLVNKIIYTELIDLTKLNKKLNKSSSDSKQIKQNNKRKHEITIVWKHIFALAKHYKVYNFIMEDLEFKKNNKESKGAEFNRQTKNLWNRGLIDNLINKYCQNIGLNKVKVNPVYSSFIGNMIYTYPDPVSASLEIGRRGIVKYIKGGSIYPELSSINQEKLNYLLGENVDKTWSNWKELYAIIPLLRYRNPVEGLKANNLGSYKSKCMTLSTQC